jgi:inosine-uridine nucleoside N-ribohydrolase
MFDGVAIGMVLWPELFETTKAFVFVDDEGFTRIDEGKHPIVQSVLALKKTNF